MREAQWRELRELIGQRFAGMRQRLVVAGDLNTLDSEPLYDEIRRDLVDAFRENRWKYGATFPNRVVVAPGPVVRIDYVLVAPAILPMWAEVLPASGSDHLAVRAVLRVPPSPDERSARAARAGSPGERKRPRG
jgi:endonuclease/exonuclease/phosphatase family metal-dependent hydrolase